MFGWGNIGRQRKHTILGIITRRAEDVVHRGNYTYQGNPPSANLPTINAYHRVATPAPTSPQNTTAMTAQTTSSSQSHMFSPNDLWIADSGATHHMTDDINNMNTAVPCSSSEKITIGNGEGLKIDHIGSISLDHLNTKLKMNTVLHVPELTANLLSIHKLCKDNNWCICV